MQVLVVVVVVVVQCVNTAGFVTGQAAMMHYG
jgi:hypothetical protein